jgi:hypothetical protein
VADLGLMCTRIKVSDDDGLFLQVVCCVEMGSLCCEIIGNFFEFHKN